MKHCSVVGLLLLVGTASAFVARRGPSGTSPCHTCHTRSKTTSWGLDLDRDAHRFSRVVAKSKGCRQSEVSLHAAAAALLLPPQSIALFYKTFPLLSGFLTCGVKAAVADTLAQRRDDCATGFNVRRNVGMSLYSASVLGLGSEIIYNRIFPR